MGDAASASAGLRATVGKGNRVRTGRRHVPWSFLGPRWRARPVTLSQITTSLGVLVPPATRLIGWSGVARGGRGRALTRRHMDVFLEAGAETQFFFFFFFLVPAARDPPPPASPPTPHSAAAPAWSGPGAGTAPAAAQPWRHRHRPSWPSWTPPARRRRCGRATEVARR